MHGGPAEVPDERALALFAAPSRVDERRAASGAYWSIRPPNFIRKGRPEAAAAMASVGSAVTPVSRPGP